MVLTERCVLEFHFMKKSRNGLGALALGISIGVVFGLLIGKPVLGVSMGIAFGLLIPILRSGRHRDR